MRTLRHLASALPVLLVVSCGYETQSSESKSLEAGTELRVELTSPLSPATQRPGDQFTATLVEPLLSGEQVVAHTGATVVGEVTDVQASDALGGESTMSLQLKEITVDNGQSVAIETDPVQYTSPQAGSAETPAGEPSPPMEQGEPSPPMEPGEPSPPMGAGEKLVTFRLAESVEVPLVADTAPAS